MTTKLQELYTKIRKYYAMRRRIDNRITELADQIAEIEDNRVNTERFSDKEE